MGFTRLDQDGIGEGLRRLATVMGLEDASSLDAGDSLFHIGLDSLMAVELAAGIQRDLGPASAEVEMTLSVEGIRK